jgi:hypothetical protein
MVSSFAYDSVHYLHLAYWSLDMTLPARMVLAGFALFTSIAAQACTFFPTPLLQLVELGDTHHIIRFRVTSHEAVSQGFARYMEGEVLQQWRGEIQESSIRINGGDGLSCLPYVSDFAVGQEWLLPVSETDGVYRLSIATQPVAVNSGVATGMISALHCPRDSEGNINCAEMTQEQRAQAYSEQMTLEEFERALQLHSDGVAMALSMCEGPHSRCTNVRPSYDPASGVLQLPGVDIISTPFNYGVSATLQLQEGSETTFEVTEVK